MKLTEKELENFSKFIIKHNRKSYLSKTNDTQKANKNRTYPDKKIKSEKYTCPNCGIEVLNNSAGNLHIVRCGGARGRGAK